MKPHFEREPEETLRRCAAEWLVRRDRGLSAQESIEFELWLADDERHVAAMQRARAAWSLLDRISERTAQTWLNASRERRRKQMLWWGGLAAAAAIAVVFAMFRPTASNSFTETGVAQTAGVWQPPQLVTFSDGTVVRLNAGSEVREQFTADERRVFLLRGEAHFTVARNPARPFVVEAGSVEARAIGTAFNVNRQRDAVEILVTEGIVAVSGGVAGIGVREADVGAELASASGRRSELRLRARQRAVIEFERASAAEAVVADLSEAEIARALAWQEPLLRLSGATLGELAAEFQRRGGDRLVLADSDLANVRVGGRFRGDDVEGFVRILAENYGIEAETTADGTIVLRRATAARAGAER